MYTPAKPTGSQRLTPFLRSLATCLYLATSLLPLCNTLRASDAIVESVNTYAQMDSMFRTVFDPLVSPGKGKGWKPFGRMEWLYGQRAFPNGDIPAGARMQAWEEKTSARNVNRTLDENWTAMGPENIAGRMISIAWHPTNTSIIYAGSASGGLWKTTNGGASWSPKTDDLPSLAIGSVVLDPNNADIVYIGTGEGSYNIDAVYGAGILKSTDGGTSWSTTGMSWTLSQGRAINQIVVHPTNSQILWCATNVWSGGGGVYKSTDGGTAWTRYLSGDAKDLVIHPDSAGVLYAAIGYPWGGSSNGVYKSTDGGLSWTLRSTGLPAATTMGRMELTISPSSPQTIYVGISQTISAGAGLLGVYRTTDGAANWTLQASTPNMYSGQGWYNLVCEVHPTNSAIVYSSGLDLYKSTNSGVSWTQKTYWNYSPGHSLYAHADHHALAFKPDDPNTIIAGTDGGLYKSTNGGDTWTGINTGLATYQFYAMCNDYLNGNVAYGGTQDNGTNKYTGTTTWSAVLGGDGAYCNVDFNNSSIIYAGTQRGAHYKSTNGGASFTSIQSGISGSGAWVTPRVMDPTNSSILYTGTTMVYKTTNGGSSWSAISSALSSQYISTIAVAPSNTQVIYVGYENNGQVWKTVNGGTNWTSCYSGLPYRYITRVAVHPTDPNTVFVTVSGYGTGHVWKSTDGGSTWSNVSTGVPDMPCNSIVIDPNDPNKLYLATDLGVYNSTNGGTSWADYSNGLPNVVVDDIALHPTTGMLRASTHGRGMWQTSTGTPSVTVLTPNGGESWIAGSAQTITWGTGGLGGTVSIAINRDYPGGTWETLAASTANDGSYGWTVTSPTTTTARIRITSVETPAATDVSNANFSITQPVITLNAPNGGQTWTVGTAQTISWTLSGTTGNVVVQLDRNYPSGSWETLTTTSSSSYSWTVTTPATGNARVKVYLQSNPSVADTSASSFAIVEPTITVTSPNGGESFTPGSLHVIRWTPQNHTGSVKIEINRSYPSGTWVTLAASISVDTLLWTVDQNATTAARIRVTSNSYAPATDISDANFTVLTPSITLTVPNGGEVLTAGSPYTIRWTRTNLSGALNVYVNREYPGGSWTAIGVSVTADTFRWNVTEPYSNTARIRVSSVPLPTILDESNASFVIGTAIVVSAPDGAESWAVGTPQTITWNRYNASGAATVQLNRSYPGGTWETLTTTVTANSHSWTVTGPATTAARVRVFLTATPAVGDTSTSNFTIPAPGIALTSPNGGELWSVGASQTVSWSRLDATGNATVQLNRNYPEGSWETITTTASGTSVIWTATSPTTSAARVRVFLTATPSVGDTSDAPFSIGTPSITLLSPNGGEAWLTGSTQVIRWTKQFSTSGVRILLNRAYPSGTWETVSNSVTADSFLWNVTAPASSAARIRIYLLTSSTVADTSTANFSIQVPSLTLTSPNGGEQWVLGEAQTIAFTRTNAEGQVTVQFNRGYPSGTWETISTTTTGSTLTWTPTGAVSSACRVRVFLNAVPSARDSSNANFSLTSASLTVASPNGGEQLAVGSTVDLSWTRVNASGGVTIALNRSYPAGMWETLATAITTSSYSWQVTSPVTSAARIRVTLDSSPSVTDESNANFTIVQSALTLTAPNGGESYTIGSPVTFRWSRTAAAGAVTVRLNRTYPSGEWETLTSIATADSFVWSSIGSGSSTCRAKINLNSDTTIYDLSAANFTLTQRSITLTSHNGGETLYTGNGTLVTFNRTNASGNATLQVNRNYPSGTWETLSTTLTGTTYTWSVAGTASVNARLRIFLTGEPIVGDTSNANFTIAAPYAVLTAPNGGEQWIVGTQQTIQWQRFGLTDNVRLELKRNYPSGSWETIAASVSGTQYNWTVSGTAGPASRIRIVSINNANIADTSDADFTIISSPITVISPNGGETAYLGFPMTIRWLRTSAPGEARVELNRNYPSGSWELLGATTQDSLIWTASGAISSAARVRVYLTATPAFADSSNANFTLQQPSIALTSPLGGERWAIGSSYTIGWTRTGLSGGVRVELNTNYPAGTWTTLASGQTGNGYSWLISSTLTDNARIRIIDETRPQYSDTSGDFSIVEPGLLLTTPNGGDTLIATQPFTIRWIRAAVTGDVKVELNRDYPSGAWELLHAGTSADSFRWTVSGAEVFHARMRVSSVSNPAIFDLSDDDFLIGHQGIQLLSPAAGDSITLGMSTTIRWSTIGITPGVNIYVKRNYPSGSWEMLASNITANSWSWTASGNASEIARFRVLSSSQPSIGDTTDGAVRIGSPLFTFLSPPSAYTYYAGDTTTLRWIRRFTTGPVRVELSRGGTGGPWEEIGTSEGDSLIWNVTGPASAIVRFRVSLISASWASGMTPFNCTIHVPSLTVTAPSAGLTQPVGRDLTISWSRSNCPWPVDVFLQRDSAPIEPIRSGVSGDSIHWIAAAPTSANSRIIIRTAGGVSIEAQSAAFALGQPQITLASPVGGESLIANRFSTIRWSRTLINDPVRIELNRNYPSGDWTTLSASSADTVFLWSITGPNTSHARIRVVSTVDPTLGDTSNSDLQIWIPDLAIGDLGRSRIIIGFPIDISWTRTFVEGAVNLYLSRDGGLTWPTMIAGGLTGNSYSWTPASPPASQARILVRSAEDASVSDTTDAFELALPQLSVNYPAGDEVLALESGIIVRWQRIDHPAPVDVQINRTFPTGSWQTIASDVDADSLHWIVTGGETSSARLRVVSDIDPGWLAESGTFSILAAALQITAPSDRQEIMLSESFPIEWQRIAHTAPVRVSVHYSNGASQTLASGLTGGSLDNVNLTTEADSAWIIVQDEATSTPRDSVRIIGPLNPQISILTPENRARWIAGRAYLLTTNRHHAEGALTVRMNTAYPTGQWSTIASIDGDSVWITAPVTESDSVAIVVSHPSRPQAADTVFGIRIVIPAVAFGSLLPEAWRISDILNVTWTNHEIDSDVRLELDRHYPSGTWETLYEGSSDSYLWTVTGDTTTHARLRIMCPAYPEIGDTLDNDLVFYLPSLRFMNAMPLSFDVGETAQISWAAEWVSGPYRLILLRSAMPPETLQSHTIDTSFEWIVTPPRIGEATLIIEDVASGLSDTSAAFAIREPLLRFTSPVETGTDTVGSVVHLAWEWTDAEGAVRLEIVRDSLNGSWETVAESVAESTFDWTVTAPGTDSLWFRATSLSDPTLSDVSAARTIIAPALSIAVNGGTTWYVGEQHWIYWTRSHYDGEVTLEMTSGDRAEPWETMASNVMVDSFLWTVTGEEADLVALRVTANHQPGVFDTTDVPLRIKLPKVEVTAPNGGEALEVGQQIRLRWIGEGFEGGVGIGLWRGEPVNRFDTLFVDTPNDSAEIWEVTEPAAHDCYLIIISLANPDLHDTSDTRFEITGGSSVNNDPFGLPREYSLNAPYPNPFNATANLEYELPRDGFVTLIIYDVMGREVERLVEEPKRAGVHRTQWRADRAASGMYFARLNSGDYQAVRKLQLIK